MAAHSLHLDRISRGDLHEVKEHVGCFNGHLFSQWFLHRQFGISIWRTIEEARRKRDVLFFSPGDENGALKYSTAVYSMLRLAFSQIFGS